MYILDSEFVLIQCVVLFIFWKGINFPLEIKYSNTLFNYSPGHAREVNSSLKIC